MANLLTENVIQKFIYLLKKKKITCLVSSRFLTNTQSLRERESAFNYLQ